MQKHHFKYFAILPLVLLLLNWPAKAQINDFGLWTSAAIEKKLNKRFELEAEIGTRFKNKIAAHDETYAETALSYSKKFFFAGCSYRFSTENDNGLYHKGHRFASHAGAEKKFGRFEADYRTKIQFQFTDIASSSDGHLPKTVWRHRFRAKYNIPKSPVDPSVSYEFFYRANQYTTKEIERERYIFSLDYKINKTNSLDFSFVLNKYMTKQPVLNRSVFSVGYKYTI